jgi:hypothetical protein
MEAREAVAQEDLRDAEAVHDRDAHLVALIAAGLHRGLGHLERDLGLQHLEAHEGAVLLRGGRRRGAAHATSAAWKSVSSRSSLTKIRMRLQHHAQKPPEEILARIALRTAPVPARRPPERRSA